MTKLVIAEVSTLTHPWQGTLAKYTWFKNASIEFIPEFDPSFEGTSPGGATQEEALITPIVGEND